MSFPDKSAPDTSSSPFQAETNQSINKEGEKTEKREFHPSLTSIVNVFDSGHRSAGTLVTEAQVFRFLKVAFTEAPAGNDSLYSAHALSDNISWKERISESMRKELEKEIIKYDKENSTL